MKSFIQIVVFISVFSCFGCLEENIPPSDLRYNASGSILIDSSGFETAKETEAILKKAAAISNENNAVIRQLEKKAKQVNAPIEVQGWCAGCTGKDEIDKIRKADEGFASN